MKRVMVGMLLALGLMAAAPAEAKPRCDERATLAQEGQPRAKFEHKKGNHQGKKNGGLRAKMAQLEAEGKLTKRERLVLQRDMAQLRGLKKVARADGTITPQERLKLEKARTRLKADMLRAAEH